MSFKPKTELVPLDELIPYAANAKTHPAEQIADLAALIRSFGFVNPILVRGDSTIIAGHGRLLAARQLELDEVPVIRCDHLTDNQARLLTLADNKVAERGGWDAGILKAELGDLKELDGDLLDLTGFHLEELDAILDEIEDIEDEPSDTSNAPEVVRFREFNLEVSKTEGDLLEARIAEYGDERGSLFGFINYLLTGVGQ